MVNQHIIHTTVWGRSSPAPSVDSFKLAPCEISFCEFKLLLSFHESTRHILFSLQLIFLIINPEKVSGVGYTSEIKNGNVLHQKQEIQ